MVPGQSRPEPRPGRGTGFTRFGSAVDLAGVLVDRDPLAGSSANGGVKFRGAFRQAVGGFFLSEIWSPPQRGPGGSYRLPDPARIFRIFPTFRAARRRIPEGGGTLHPQKQRRSAPASPGKTLRDRLTSWKGTHGPAMPFLPSAERRATRAERPAPPRRVHAGGPDRLPSHRENRHTTHTGPPVPGCRPSVVPEQGPGPPLRDNAGPRRPPGCPSYVPATRRRPLAGAKPAAGITITQKEPHRWPMVVVRRPRATASMAHGCR